MFASKHAVSRPVDSPVAAAPDFPSEEVMQKIRGLADQIAKLKIEFSDAEAAHALAVQNRGIIQLINQNSDDVIQKARSAVDSARQGLSRAKNELTRAFIAACGECEKTRAESWARMYSDVVRPRAAKISSALDGLERAIDELVEVFDPESETVRRLEALDAATGQWNAFVGELGGPGNAALRTTSGLSGLRASFAQEAKPRRLEAALNRLREVLNPTPPPVPFKTEEQLAAERRRAEENTLAAAREVDQQMSSMREKELLLQSKK